MTVQELYQSIDGNYDAAKGILMMDKLITKFVIKFLDDKSYEKLANAWAARDVSGAFEGAHALKGVCANLGMNKLSGLASELAEEFRPGSARKLSDDEVTQRLAAITELYEKSIGGIRAFAAAQ